MALEVKIGDETWTVVDSPSGAPVEAGDLATDARYAILRSAPGRPDYVLSFEATRIERGKVAYRWPVRTSVELGGFTPPDRP